MTAESKYYYSKYKYRPYSSSQPTPEIIKWNKNYYVTINENIDHWVHLDVTVNKYKKDSFDKPVSSEYEKVRPILEELFLDYYFQGLRYLNEKEFDDNEFYIIEKRKSWYQVVYYSKNEKYKSNMVIDFIDSIDDLWLRISMDTGHKGRPGARKNGEPVSFPDFKQYLNLSLKFLSDPNSYPIYLEPFINNFKNLAAGKKVAEAFDVTAERSFNLILDQLTSRKKAIEKLLIEDDKLEKNERIKLRGELSGIEYGIKTVNIHK